MSDDRATERAMEMELAGSEIAIAGDAVLADELAVEKALWRSVLWGMVIAVPICVAIWCVIVAVAVGPEDGVDWLAWLGIGAIVGVLAAGFFGGWAGFTMKAHMLDEVDHRASQRR